MGTNKMTIFELQFLLGIVGTICGVSLILVLAFAGKPYGGFPYAPYRIKVLGAFLPLNIAYCVYGILTLENTEVLY